MLPAVVQVTSRPQFVSQTRTWFGPLRCLSLLGLERAPSASHSVWTAKRQHPLKGSHCSALEQDSSDQHAEPLELQEYDFSCEEQRVPAYAAYQPNRSPKGNQKELIINHLY